MNKNKVSDILVTLASLAANGITLVSEAQILFEVSKEPKTISEISEALTMPISTVSRLVWNLKEQGWLKYEADPKDRRKKVIRADLLMLEDTARGKK